MLWQGILKFYEFISEIFTSVMLERSYFLHFTKYMNVYLNAFMKGNCDNFKRNS